MTELAENAEINVSVTSAGAPPRQCQRCMGMPPAGTRADDEWLYFGAHADDRDRRHCSSCARTLLHERGQEHISEGCQACPQTNVMRAEIKPVEQRMRSQKKKRR